MEKNAITTFDTSKESSQHALFIGIIVLRFAVTSRYILSIPGRNLQKFHKFVESTNHHPNYTKGTPHHVLCLAKISEFSMKPFPSY